MGVLCHAVGGVLSQFLPFVFTVSDIEDNSPPRAQAGGRHVLTLPNNSITLDGSRSTDDRGIVSYLWIRDGQSPAAGVST